MQHNILISGAAGQLGQDFQAITAEFPELHFIFVDRAGLDITNKEAVENYISEKRPDLIFNCAAYTNVEEAETDIKKNYHVNSAAPGQLAEICKAHGIPLIHVSTDYVFDGNFDRPILEDDFPRPINAYGRAKLEGEMNIQKVGGEHYIIRTSWLYSTFGHNFVKTMRRLAATHGKLNVVTDQWGAPTYARQFARDVNRMIIRILHQKDVPTGVYHYSQDGITTWYEFAKKIVSLWNLNVPVSGVTSAAFQTKANRPKYSKLDPAKFEKTMHLQIPSWEQGLMDCFNDENKAK